MDLWLGDGSGAFQEIKVATFVSLFDVLHEKFSVAAGKDAFLWAPGGPAAGQFIVAHEHIALAGGDVQFDEVALFQQRQRTADEGFGRDVEDAGAITCAAHASVGNADHVADASFEQLFRKLEIAPFWHAWAAFRARVAEHEDAVGVDIEIRIVETRVHFVEAVEDDGVAGVLEEARFREIGRASCRERVCT